MERNIIKVEKVKKYFSELLVLNDVSLKIQRSNVVVICGPSGCGKSTLLKCINGLEGFRHPSIHTLAEKQIAPFLLFMIGCQICLRRASTGKQLCTMYQILHVSTDIRCTIQRHEYSVGR